MKKILIAVLMVLVTTTPAYAWNGYDEYDRQVYNQYIKAYTQGQVYQSGYDENENLYPNQNGQYYMNGNGRIKPTGNGRPRQYEDWTYVDENGYDYTIIIEVK